MASPTDRAHAQRLDAADPLAGLRARFRLPVDDLVYFDGNSLGMLPLATEERLRRAVGEEWGGELVRGWQHWIDLPVEVGDLLGAELLGAGPGQVVVCDSTTVNLYKLVRAAVDARPGRRVLVTDDDNFPTDRYVLEGIAQERGLQLRIVNSDPVHGVDLDRLASVLNERTAVVSLSHVAYRSGALLDLEAATELAHRVGAFVVWDVAHSVGALPVDLDATGADMAVGCTYKYVNAGPGAPAFLYVRRALQDTLRQPIWGWFGQRDQFGMGPGYHPVDGVGRFLTGTPNILGSYAVEHGVRVLADAGVARLREKGSALTAYLIELADAWLRPLGFELATPRAPARRGSHVSLRHPDAFRIARALIERANVVPDFRGPDRLRLGPAPVTTRFVDVWDGMDRLRALVDSAAYRDVAEAPARVT